MGGRTPPLAYPGRGPLPDAQRLPSPSPLCHWTETPLRGHIAVCVYASLLEALIRRDLRAADLRDPDLPHQHLSAARAL